MDVDGPHDGRMLIDKLDLGRLRASEPKLPVCGYGRKRSAYAYSQSGRGRSRLCLNLPPPQAGPQGDGCFPGSERLIRFDKSDVTD